MKIAICTVCYNRLDSLKRLLTSLENAYYDEPATLIISIDKSKTTIVEDYADQYKWPHGELRVVKHEQNLGLRKHILSIGEYLNEFDAIVVLEDDICVSQSFYYYTKQCVEKYHDDDTIAGISLYNFPFNYHCHLPFMPLQSDSDVYLMKTAVSWGQVWMRKQWGAFIEWYKQHNEEFDNLPHLPYSICAWAKSSWLKYHIRYCIEQNKYFVYPYKSHTTCFCDLGTHAKKKKTHTHSSLLYGIQTEYKLTPIIKYDGFFEPESLYSTLHLSESELCIDFYGEKENRLKRQFLLTRKQLPYKVTKSFALEYKPWELNVMNEIEGNELFLYDTQVEASKPDFKHNADNFDFYLYTANTDLSNVFYKTIYSMVLDIKHKLFGYKKKR